jgi:hypothetical protein
MHVDCLRINYYVYTCTVVLVRSSCIGHIHADILGLLTDGLFLVYTAFIINNGLISDFGYAVTIVTIWHAHDSPIFFSIYTVCVCVCVCVFDFKYKFELHSCYSTNAIPFVCLDIGNNFVMDGLTN